ncbi:MAG: spondin domain-containing protein, partial [Planctomycetota bacterium]
MNCRAIMATAAIAALAPSAVAEITVTIENTNPEGGFFLTPVWIGIHDGTFDTNDAGVPAAMFPGLTEIAEGGNTAPLSGALCSAGAGGTALQSTVIATLGAGGAPVLDP